MPELPTKFFNFLNRLKKVREIKPGLTWSACCPAHPDERPSLSVNIGRTGNLVVTCHSPAHGCTAAAIVKSVGLTMSDLFAADKPGFERTASQTARPKPDNVYAYQYEDGRLAYETCRYNPKSFAQRRPNPKWTPGGTESRYIWNLDETRLVLYRLPKLIEELAKQPDRWVALVEGEKCADTLEAIGILATTHALGADHWYREYATDGPLKGKRVAIFYDLDPWHRKQRKRAGVEWAIQAARDLHAVGCQVRICLPPDSKGKVGTKYDVADYVFANASHGADKLKRTLAGVIADTADYFPGWENMTAYDSLQLSHRNRLNLPFDADMNDLMLTVRRKLDAAMSGVSLDSLPSDMAEMAAWFQWLAERLSPRLTKLNMIVGEFDPDAPPVVENKAAQSSEPQGEADETAEAAHEKNPAQGEDAAQALCLPQKTAEAVAGHVEDVPRGEDGEPEVI